MVAEGDWQRRTPDVVVGALVRMRTIVTKTNKNNTTTRGEQPSRTTRVTDEITEDGANVTLIETGTGSDATGTTDGAATLTDAATMSDTLRDATDAGPTGMRVTKRNGAVEPVDLNKIVNAIARASEGLLGVDPMRVATRTISALADGSVSGFYIKTVYIYTC